MDQVIGALASISLDVRLEEIPCSNAQLKQALNNIQSEMTDLVDSENVTATSWFNTTQLIDTVTNTRYGFGTRLIAAPQENASDLVTIFSEVKSHNYRTGEENISDRFGYQWYTAPDVDEVSITMFDTIDGSEKVVLSADDERYREAVGIIVSAHEGMFGTDPRLLTA